MVWQQHLIFPVVLYNTPFSLLEPTKAYLLTVEDWKPGMSSICIVCVTWAVRVAVLVEWDVYELTEGVGEPIGRRDEQEATVQEEDNNMSGMIHRKEKGTF